MATLHHYMLNHKEPSFLTLTIMLDTQSEYLSSRTRTSTDEDDERSRISNEMGLNTLGFHRITLKKIPTKQPQMK